MPNAVILAPGESVEVIARAAGSPDAVHVVQHGADGTVRMVGALPATVGAPTETTN